jgi:hypothetical protein
MRRGGIMWNKDLNKKFSTVWKFGAVFIVLLVIGCIQEVVSTAEAGGNNQTGFIHAKVIDSFNRYNDIVFVKQNGVLIHLLYDNIEDSIPVEIGNIVTFHLIGKYSVTKKEAICVNDSLYIVN